MVVSISAGVLHHCVKVGIPGVPGCAPGVHHGAGGVYGNDLSFSMGCRRDWRGNTELFGDKQEGSARLAGTAGISNAHPK